MQKIFLGADHGGRILKDKLKRHLQADYEVVDLGAHEAAQDDDEPVYAAAVGMAVRRTPGSLGILACRSAAGMAMAANRLPGIRAAAVHDAKSAEHARVHNDTNIIALSGEWLDEETATEAVRAWLETEASTEPRYARRRHELERIGEATVEAIPGIFEEDPELVNQRAHRLRQVASILHIDVADGALVPAKAFPRPDDADRLDPAGTLEAHLMVQQPAAYVAAWKAAGATRLVGHVEASGIAEFLSTSKANHLETGLGIDLPTDVSALDPHLASADFVLVMGVKAGKSGQEFGEAAYLKIAQIKAAHPDLVIEVDGGVNDITAPGLVTAGADRLVSTSFVTNAEDPQAALARLADPWHGDR